jgi:hypothetical protein
MTESKSAASVSRIRQWMVNIGAGIAFAVSGVFVYRHIHYVGSFMLPWGAALAIAAAALHCRVVRQRTGSGGASGTIALTWVIVTALVAELSGKDLLIANDALSIGYLIGGALVIGGAGTWPSTIERQRWRGLKR